MTAEPLARRLLRYAAVALILGVIGILFVRQQSDRPAVVEETSVASADGTEVVVGAPAPEISLLTREGTPFRLSEARGKVVVVNFWASWCAPCREEMPGFEAAYQERSSDVLFVGVNTTSVDTRAEALAFAERLGVTFPIVMDTEGVAQRTYGVRGLPATFFIGRDGTMKAKALGPVLKDRLREQLELAAAP